MGDYSILRAAEAPDFTGDAPGAFLGYGRPLGSEQLGFNLRVLPPHSAHRPPGMEPGVGHSHQAIEEIYLVVSGEVKIKIGDEVVTLGPRDAVRIAASTRRAIRNDGDAEAVLVMCSARVEDPQADVRWHEGFWPNG